MQPSNAAEPSSETLDLEPTPLVAAEYSALRAEILQRMQTEAQLTTFALVALGTLLAAGVQFKNADLILVYPFVALALAIAWAAEDRGIQYVGLYIAGVLEGHRVDKHLLSYETYIRKVPGFRGWYRNSVRLLFLLTQVLTLFIANSISADMGKTSIAADIGNILGKLWSLHLSPGDLSFDVAVFLFGILSTIATQVVLPFDDKRMAKQASKIIDEARSGPKDGN
jgi:hypothetical protein